MSKQSQNSYTEGDGSIPIPPEITDAAKTGHLVLFVGAGVSRLLKLPSWDDLANKQLKHLYENDCLNYSEKEQLKILDPKKKLSIAKRIAADKDKGLDFRKHLEEPSGKSSIYSSINEIGCPCVTTNYDELLYPNANEYVDDSTVSTSRRINRKEGFSISNLDPGTVIHLHGSISEEREMVYTTKQYIEHYTEPDVQKFLQDMFSQRVVLFIGYGLEESEILEQILRSGETTKGSSRKKLFALQGYFLKDKYLHESLRRYYLEFDLHIIDYIMDERGHHRQEDIISDWKNEIIVSSLSKTSKMQNMAGVLKNG